MKYTMRQARNLKGIAQKDMAKRLDISLVTYQRYEKIKDSHIKLSKARKFSEIVNIPMDDIIFVEL